MNWKPQQGYTATEIYPYVFEVFPYEDNGITRWGWTVQDWREMQGSSCGGGNGFDTPEEAMKAAEQWLE